MQLLLSRLTTSLKNQRGITLMNVMMAVAIGGVVMLGLASGMTMMIKARKNLDAHTEASEFVDRANTILQKQNLCKSTLAAVVAPPGVATPITIDGFSEANPQLAPGIIISELKIIVDPTQSLPIPGTSFTKEIAHVRIQITNNSDIANPLLSRRREIPVQLIMMSGSIVDCQATVPEAAICNQLDSNYDPTQPAGQQCLPTKSCQYGGAYSLAPLSSGGFVNPFSASVNGGQSCPSGFTAQRSGTITVAETCGKDCVQNRSFDTYSCIRCGTPLNAQEPGVVANGTINPLSGASADAAAADTSGDQNGANTNLMLSTVPIY